MQTNALDVTSSVNGKAAVVRRDTQPGDVIYMVQEPLVAALDTDRLLDTCYYCYIQPTQSIDVYLGCQSGNAGSMKQTSAIAPPSSPPRAPTTNLLICTGCRCVRYCSKVCQKTSWKIHKHECKIFNRLQPRVLPHQVRAVIRLLLMLDHGLFTNTEWNDIMACQSHRKEFMYRQDQDLSDLFLMSKAAKEYSKSPKSLEEILELFFIMKINAMTLMTGWFEPIGVFLHPLMAKINHSCNPNVYIRFSLDSRARTVEVTPLREILADEEVTVSYIDEYQPISLRREELQRRYFFRCRCTRCEREAEQEQQQQQQQQQKRDVQGTPMETFTPTRAKSGRGDLYQEALSLWKSATTQQGQPSPKTRSANLHRALFYLGRNWTPNHYPFPQILQQLVVSYIDDGQHNLALAYAALQHFQVDPEVYEPVFHPLRLLHTYVLIRLLTAVIYGDDGDNGGDDNGVNNKSNNSNKRRVVQKLDLRPYALDLRWWRSRFMRTLEREAGKTYASGVRFRDVAEQSLMEQEGRSVLGGFERLDEKVGNGDDGDDDHEILRRARESWTKLFHDIWTL